MDTLPRWMKRVCVGVLACSGLAAVAADPVVSNVRAAQRAGTGLFEITYDLEDADTTNLTVTVAISTNNGAAWFAPATSNLSGAVGAFAVSPGTDKTVFWQGCRELPARLFPSVKARITADDTPPPTLYLVIDLSGGTNAASYPVSSFDTVPGGANSDLYKTTSLLMRLISKGNFTMGSPNGELGRNSDETQHTVTLTKDFYIGVFEVTQRQWQLVMGNRPSYYRNVSYYASRPVELVSYYDIRGSSAGAGWPASGNVDATSFLGLLRNKTGLANFDLPTESQWEYACRAGSTKALNSGYNLTNTTSDAHMTAVGRYYYNGGSGSSQDGSPTRGTAKVGTYLPNAWGLYDMHGNVSEWCLDWYGTYNGASSDPLGAMSGADRVYRGGAFNKQAQACRSANRIGSQYNEFVGFRVARIMP